MQTLLTPGEFQTHPRDVGEGEGLAGAAGAVRHPVMPTRTVASDLVTEDKVPEPRVRVLPAMLCRAEP